MDDLEAYVALALAPGIGPSRFRTLLDACTTPDGAFSAPFAFLCSLPGFSRAVAGAVRSTTRDEGRKAIEQARAGGAEILVAADSRFPESLRQIPDAPMILFAAGRLELLEAPAAAIVGSRQHSAYGASVCRSVATRAAQAGIAVVSGMARGLDAIAHIAALDAGGGSIGVLGNGIGVIYPAANRALYERMREHGLLLTEFPPGERPHAGSFHRRNRLISGLARVTVVIEAAAGSGTLITVDCALNQGRDVMAVPGTITSAVSIGTNRLIRDGAMPLLEPDDLLALFPGHAPVATGGRAQLPLGPTFAEPRLPLPPGLSPDEMSVATLIGGDRIHVDDLAARAARPVAELLAILCGLEIQGVVHQEPGRMFRR